MMSYSERVLRINANASSHTIYASPGFTEKKVQDQVETLAHVLESEDQDLPCTPAQGQDPTPAPLRSASEVFDNAELRVEMHQMTQREAERVFTSSVQSSMTKVAEEAIYDAFQIGFGFC